MGDMKASIFVAVDSEEAAVLVVLDVVVVQVTMNPSAPAGGPLDGAEAPPPAHQILILTRAHLHGTSPLARRILTQTHVRQLGTRRQGRRTRMP
jgi:hypothetical protein